MAITVDPDGLAADGAALADWQTVESAPGCEPASAHCVSVGVAVQLAAHSASLTALINHAQLVRTEGGAVTQHCAASLRAADEANADVIASKTLLSGAVSTPMAVTAVPAPVLAAIPPMPALPTIPGESHAAALHTGPGPASLRALAECWCSRAAALDNVAADTAHTSASIDAHWSDGGQHAGANTAVHSTWWSEMAGRARTLASAAYEAADHHDRAVAATPTPQEFTDAHHRLTNATAANRAAHGLLSAQVSAAAAHLAQMQSQATDAAAAHHSASVETMSSIQQTPGPAPGIATASSSAASASPSGNRSAAANSAQLATGPGMAAAGPTAVPGGGAVQQMAMSALPALPMMGMAPMSALSGLGGLSRSGAPTGSRLAEQSGAAAPDADTGLTDELGDTLPAADGGGNAQAFGGEAAQPPVSRASPLSATAVSGPAGSVGVAAEQAATSPAGGAAGPGMSTYPPMSGASGVGEGAGQRDIRLYPDRRVVWRPAPNTEAVFGELQRERRSRVKRTAPEEGTDEG